MFSIFSQAEGDAFIHPLPSSLIFMSVAISNLSIYVAQSELHVKAVAVRQKSELRLSDRVKRESQGLRL